MTQATNAAHNVHMLVRELSIIVKSNSVSELSLFRHAHPEITMLQTAPAVCVCGCTDHCDAFSSVNMNSITHEFIDALFDLRYITDAIVLCDIFSYMNSYQSWVTVNYFISKFDSEALRSSYRVMDKGTPYEYIDDPLTCLYTACHVTHYWGKLHPGARECYERLTAAGCMSRYSTPQVDRIKRHFTDNTYHIKWQQEHNTESFLEFQQTTEYQEWLKI